MTDFSDLQNTARRLVGHLDLGEIRLFEARLRHKNFPRPGDVPELGPIDLQLQGQAATEDQVAFVLVVRTSVIVPPENDESNPLTVARCRVAYGARYSVDRDTVGEITQGETQAFGFTVAALTLWPYIRAHLANGLREMNLPLVDPLPVLTQADLAGMAAGMRANATSVESDAV